MTGAPAPTAGWSGFFKFNQHSIAFLAGFCYCMNEQTKLLQEVMTMTFAEIIVMHRRKLGLTQEGLAQKLGVTNQAVSKWESGVSQS